MKWRILGAVEIGTQGPVRKQRFPYPRRQFDGPLRGVLADALEDIDQVGVGIHLLQPAGGQQALDDADPLGAQLRFHTRTALLIVDEIGYVSIDPDGANLFFQLVNARYEKGAMILTSNRGFAEWGDLFGDPVVATALLNRLLHHAIVIHIEGASYRLREHTDLVPEHVRANAPIAPPPPPKRRGRPPGNKRKAADARP